MDLHSRDLAQRYGITGPQLAVLRELLRLGTSPVGELARSVNLSHGTVTGIIDRLFKRGFIERVRGEADRRRVWVTATEEARTLLAQMPPPLQDHFTHQFERLQDWEQTQILSCLQRLVAMMETRDSLFEPIPKGATLPLHPVAEPGYLDGRKLEASPAGDLDSRMTQ